MTSITIKQRNDRMISKDGILLNIHRCKGRNYKCACLDCYEFHTKRPIDWKGIIQLNGNIQGGKKFIRSELPKFCVKISLDTHKSWIEKNDYYTYQVRMKEEEDEQQRKNKEKKEAKERKEKKTHQKDWEDEIVKVIRKLKALSKGYGEGDPYQIIMDNILLFPKTARLDLLSRKIVRSTWDGDLNKFEDFMGSYTEKKGCEYIWNFSPTGNEERMLKFVKHRFFLEGERQYVDKSNFEYKCLNRKCEKGSNCGREIINLTEEVVKTVATNLLMRGERPHLSPIF